LKQSAKALKLSDLLRRLLVSLGFQPLLANLGLEQQPERRTFALDEDATYMLHLLAEYEQRPEDEVISDLLAFGVAQQEAAERTLQCWSSLSPREQQVAAMTCLECTNYEIAARLIISPDTVKSHMRSVLYKFDLHSKRQLRRRLADWDFSAFDV